MLGALEKFRIADEKIADAVCGCPSPISGKSQRVAQRNAHAGDQNRVDLVARGSAETGRRPRAPSGTALSATPRPRPPARLFLSKVILPKRRTGFSWRPRGEERSCIKTLTKAREPVKAMPGATYDLITRAPARQHLLPCREPGPAQGRAVPSAASDLLLRHSKTQPAISSYPRTICPPRAALLHCIANVATANGTAFSRRSGLAAANLRNAPARARRPVDRNRRRPRGNDSAARRGGSPRGSHRGRSAPGREPRERRCKAIRNVAPRRSGRRRRARHRHSRAASPAISTSMAICPTTSRRRFCTGSSIRRPDRLDSHRDSTRSRRAHRGASGLPRIWIPVDDLPVLHKARNRPAPAAGRIPPAAEILRRWCK